MTPFYFYHNIPEDCAFITLRKSKSITHTHYSLAFFDTWFGKKIMSNKQAEVLLSNNPLSVWRDIVTGRIDCRSDMGSRQR